VIEISAVICFCALPLLLLAKGNQPGKGGAAVAH